MAHFFVAIAYNKGVILCKQYNEKLTGESFANFLKEFFPATFERSANAHGKLFLQDGDPRQVSRRAKQAMDEIGCRMFSIPARSPDLNPIENVFHLVRKNLHKDALNWEIKKETFEDHRQNHRLDEQKNCNYCKDKGRANEVLVFIIFQSVFLFIVKS